MQTQRGTWTLVGAALLLGLTPLATSQDAPPRAAPKVGVADYADLAAVLRDLPAYQKAWGMLRALPPKQEVRYRNALEQHLHRELRTLVARFGRRFGYDRIHWLSARVRVSAQPETPPFPPGLAYSRADDDVTQALRAYLRHERTRAWLAGRALPAPPVPEDLAPSRAPPTGPRVGVVDLRLLAERYARKPLFEEALASLTPAHTSAQRDAYRRTLEERFGEEISTTVRDYGKRYGYSIVLDRSGPARLSFSDRDAQGPALLYRDAALDITPTVLKFLNQPAGRSGGPDLPPPPPPGRPR